MSLLIRRGAGSAPKRGVMNRKLQVQKVTGRHNESRIYISINFGCWSVKALARRRHYRRRQAARFYEAVYAGSAGVDGAADFSDGGREANSQSDSRQHLLVHLRLGGRVHSAVRPGRSAATPARR